jgi:hypothetical protein
MSVPITRLWRVLSVSRHEERWKPSITQTCDTRALRGASPVADVFGPVVALARGCLARAGHGLSGRGVVVKVVVRRGVMRRDG